MVPNLWRWYASNARPIASMYLRPIPPSAADSSAARLSRGPPSPLGQRAVAPLVQLHVRLRLAAEDAQAVLLEDVRDERAHLRGRAR